MQRTELIKRVTKFLRLCMKKLMSCIIHIFKDVFVTVKGIYLFGIRMEEKVKKKTFTFKYQTWENCKFALKRRSSRLQLRLVLCSKQSADMLRDRMKLLIRLLLWFLAIIYF